MIEDSEDRIINNLKEELKESSEADIFFEIERMNVRLGVLDEEYRFIHRIIDACRGEINERLDRLAD